MRRSRLRPVRVAVLCAATLLPSLVWAQGVLYPGMDGAELRAALRASYGPAGVLGYGPARDSLFSWEQRQTGQLCGVYTRFCIVLTPGADPSTSAFEQGINTEHTWPQSRGAENEPFRSDMHHLFPAKDNVNSSRGNHPYAEIPDAQTQAWYRGADAQSNTPSVFLDEWSERADGNPAAGFTARFEPREDHAGNAARAVFYVATMYEAQVDLYASRPFLGAMLADLLDWNQQDPPDALERARSSWIASRQGTENPFILDATLAARAFGDYATTTPGGGGTSGAAGLVWINEIHYDNVSGDSGEFIEIAGPAGTLLDGWQLVLYNGNGGAVYDTRTLAGTLPDQGGGFGALAVGYPPNGIQNGSPDGIALVDDNGDVAQFISYEGTMIATDGPALDSTSVDIGVEESGTTPLGFSVQLAGTGERYLDFVWQSPSPASPGFLNVGQQLVVTTPAPPARTLLAVAVAPNPLTSGALVTLALDAPAVDADVTVLDVLGRPVATLHTGPAAGPLALRLDAHALAPGVYVVRAVVDGRTGIARAVVVR